MVIVLASVLLKAENLDRALASSLVHCARSRAEPGCVSHAVHRDAANPNRLVFVEEWSDPAAVAAHFAVPASQAFVQEVTALAETPPVLRMFEATPLSL